MNERDKVLKAFDRYWETVQRRGADAFEELLPMHSEALTTILSASHEYADDYQQAIKLLEDDLSSPVESLRISFKDKAVTIRKNSAIVMCRFSLKAILANQDIHFPEFRVSQVFEKDGDTWQVLHIHTSLPAEGQTEGDLYGVEKLKSQNEKLQKKVAERTHELQLKNTELELALKRLTNAQDKLIYAEKMSSLGQLTAGVAHEIRNPLNFISNFAKISVDLVKELDSALENQHNFNRSEDLDEILSDLKGCTHKIAEHGSRIDRIVLAMLEHSRSGLGEIRKVNINKLIDQYVELAIHGISAREAKSEINIQKEYSQTAGEISVYPKEIGRVVINLIENAFYATHEDRVPVEGNYNPEIIVSTRRYEEALMISISDNGVGMSEEVRQKMFEPFFTTKPPGKGTGLGLSVSYDIITKGHSGTLTVDSEPNVGTTIKIELPIC